MSDDIQYTVNG